MRKGFEREMQVPIENGMLRIEIDMVTWTKYKNSTNYQFYVYLSASSRGQKQETN